MEGESNENAFSCGSKVCREGEGFPTKGPHQLMSFDLGHPVCIHKLWSSSQFEVIILS